MQNLNNSTMAEIIKEKVTQIPESAQISELNCIDLSCQDVQSSVSLLKQAILSHFFLGRLLLFKHLVYDSSISWPLMEKSVFRLKSRLVYLPLAINFAVVYYSLCRNNYVTQVEKYAHICGSLNFSIIN